MDIQSAFNTGVQGFQNATEKANEAATNIAANTLSNEATDVAESAAKTNPSSNQDNVPDLNQSIVDLKVAEFQAKASSQVIQSADETLGTLLDVTA